MKTTPSSTTHRIADFIIHPWQQESNKRCLAWAIAIILGIITLGSAQLISWIILKITRGPVNHEQSSRINKISKPILVPERVTPQTPTKIKYSSLEEALQNPAVKELHAIRTQLLEGECEGWLEEHRKAWKLDLKYAMSTDYIKNAKNYLQQLLSLKNKTEKEREEMFDRGLKAERVLHDIKKLQPLLTGEIWYKDGITEENLLINASKHNSKSKAIPLLLQAGIDPNQRDDSGNTPLHWAVANAAVDCAFTLIQYAAQYNIDFNLQDWRYSCMTPLQLAICKGRRDPRWDDLVIKLIALTSDLDKQDEHGNTALHLACVRRDHFYIRALQKAGASFNIQNKNGEIPKDLWSVSSDEAWKILKGSEVTHTFDREGRELAGRKFPQEFNEQSS